MDRQGRDEGLRTLAESVSSNFSLQKRVLSFAEYLRECGKHPERHLRDAPRYLLDAFHHFGSYTLQRPEGEVRRFRLFDGEEEVGPARRLRLVGHERTQEAFYKALVAFVRRGQANRLLLLHGPNGSAKSTFVACLMRGLERYSEIDEGALYRFSWVFPSGQDDRHIGFSGTARATSQLSTFAHLPDSQVGVKLRSPVREHPLLLLPRAERRQWFERNLKGEVSQVPRLLWEGALSHGNKQIAEALLVGYQGDYERVLAHVQVERFSLSRRYRRGLVNIGPQLSVDARERQLTADLSLNALPASLASLSLFNAEGPLVDGSRGLTEFSDLLKRPLDAWRYLLSTVETGEVSLGLSTLPLDTVMVGSSNDVHLEAFRQHHEYLSFRGRLRLQRMPYLLDFTQEAEVYRSQIAERLSTSVAPRLYELAAHWAVLTRLRRPRAENYASKALGRIAAALMPLEKAQFYAEGRIPERFTAEDAAELSSAYATVRDEYEAGSEYEGSFGMSPRDMSLVLLQCADEPGYFGLSVLALLRSLELFCDRSDHEFLKVTADQGYHDVSRFLEDIRGLWLDHTEADLRAGLRWVEPGRERALLERYVAQVSAGFKGEKVRNTLTGHDEEPDEAFMADVEAQLGVEDGTHFRGDLMNKLAAFAIQHPDAAVLDAVLGPHAKRLADAHYEKQRGQISRLLNRLLERLARVPEAELAATSLSSSLEGFTEEEAVIQRICEAESYAIQHLREALRELSRLRFE